MQACAAVSSDGACGRESPWKASQEEEEEACTATQPSVFQRALLAVQFSSLLLSAVALVTLYRVRKNPSYFFGIAVSSFATFCLPIGEIRLIVMPPVWEMLKSVGWINLETMLLGSIFIYFSVLYTHLVPSIWCNSALIRWVRFFGFLALYGPEVLQLCSLVIAASVETRLTPAPGCCELGTLVSLSVLLWLSTSVGTESPPIGVRQGLNFQCPPGFVDHSLSSVEAACLVWSLRVCHTMCKTTLPCQGWTITAALINEAVCSLLFHMFWRLLAPALHPDWMILIAFMHEHFTVTINLGLLLIPKFVRVELLLPEIAVDQHLERNDYVRPSTLTARVETNTTDINCAPKTHLESLRSPKARANVSVLSFPKKGHLRRGHTIFRRLTRRADGTLRSFTWEGAGRERRSSATSEIHAAPLLMSANNPAVGTSSSSSSKKRLELCKKFTLSGSCSSTNRELRELNVEKLSKSEAKICSPVSVSTVPKKVSSHALEEIPLVCCTDISHSSSHESSLCYYFDPLLKQKSLGLMDCAPDKALTDQKKASSQEDIARVYTGNRDVRPNYLERQQKDTTSNQWKAYSLPKLYKSCWKKEHKYSFENSDTYEEAVASYKMKQSSYGAVSNREEICPWEFQELPSSKSSVSKKINIKKNTSIGSTKLNSLEGFEFAGKFLKAMRSKTAEGKLSSPSEVEGRKSWPTLQPRSGSSSPAGKSNFKPFGDAFTAQMEQTTLASGHEEANRCNTHDGTEHTLQTYDTGCQKLGLSESKKCVETLTNAGSSWKLPSPVFSVREPHLEEMVEIFPWNLGNVQTDINKNESPDWEHTKTKVGIKLETSDTENKASCRHGHGEEDSLDERYIWEMDSDQQLTTNLSVDCKRQWYDVTEDCQSMQSQLGWLVGFDGEHELLNNTDAYPSGVRISPKENAGGSVSGTMILNQSVFGNGAAKQSGSETSTGQHHLDMDFGKKEIDDISLDSMKDNFQCNSADVSSSEPMDRVPPQSGQTTKTVTFREPPVLTPPCGKKKSDKSDLKCYGLTLRDLVSSGRNKR